MKIILFCIIVLMTGVCSYSQNTLLDGIEQSSDVSVYGKTITDAYGKEISQCTFNYSCYVEDIDGEYADNAKWNWKDIISAVIVNEKSLLLETSGKVINHDYDEGEEFVDESFVWIYFKTAEMAKSAQEWALARITLCGGSATK